MPCGQATPEEAGPTRGNIPVVVFGKESVVRVWYKLKATKRADTPDSATYLSKHDSVGHHRYSVPTAEFSTLMASRLREARVSGYSSVQLRCP